jgi:hypothetical protein
MLEITANMDTGDFFQDMLVSGFTSFPNDLIYPYMAIKSISKIPKNTQELNFNNAGILDVLCLAEDLECYMKGIFVHELGHHIIFESDPVVAQFIRMQFTHGKPISKYGGDNWEEYFCESLVAYTYHPNILKWYDEVGYGMVQNVLRQIEV